MKKVFSLILLFVGFLPSSLYAKISWKTLTSGIEQARYQTQGAQGEALTLQLFRIDLHKNQIQIGQAKDYGLPNVTMKDLAQRRGALLAINGGFFDPQYKSLGLLVNEGKTLNPFRQVSWWASFILNQNIPQILKTKKITVEPSMEMAIQAGPRLVQDGKPVSSNPKFSRKSFIGITSQNQVVLGVTEDSFAEINDLARILAEEIKLTQALNLDGGRSTQLYAKIGTYEKDLPGFSPVANGIVVVSRKN